MNGPLKSWQELRSQHQKRVLSNLSLLFLIFSFYIMLVCSSC